MLYTYSVLIAAYHMLYMYCVLIAVYHLLCTMYCLILQVDRIDAIRKTGNSIGGVVECVARNVPVSDYVMYYTSSYYRERYTSYHGYSTTSQCLCMYHCNRVHGTLAYVELRCASRAMPWQRRYVGAYVHYSMCNFA
jgi:hypothetical protein